MNYWWTQQDEDTLKRLVPSKGQRYVAKKLGRSLEAIRKKAAELGVEFGESASFTKVTTLALDLDMNSRYLRSFAADAGVLTRRADGNHVIYTIPKTWARDFAKQYEPIEHQHEELRQAGFLNSTEAAKQLGIAVTSLRRWYRGLHPEGIDEILEVLDPIMTTSLNGQHRLFNPHNVSKAETLLRQRLAPAEWATSEAVANSLGLIRQQIRRTANKLGIEPTYAISPATHRREPFFTLDQQQEIRAFYAQRPAPQGWTFLPFLAARLSVSEDDLHRHIKHLKIPKVLAQHPSTPTTPGFYILNSQAERLAELLATQHATTPMQQAA